MPVASLNFSRLIIRPRGLIAQLRLWVIVPLLIILIAVTYGSNWTAYLLSAVGLFPDGI